MSASPRIIAAIERYRRVKPASGQRSLWTDEDERKHPRDKNGEFAEKGEPSSVAAESDAVGSAQKDYASNGVKSKAFKQWFGDWEHDAANSSKVVNSKGEPQETAPLNEAASKVMKDGKPLTVHHGTAHGGWNEFDKSKVKQGNLYGPGFYFTEDVEIATEYQRKGSENIGRISASQAGTLNRFIKEHLPANWKDVIFANQTEPGGWDGPAGDDNSNPFVGMVSDPLTHEDLHIPQTLNWDEDTRGKWNWLLDMMGVNTVPAEVKTVYLNIRKPIDLESRLTTKVADAIGPALAKSHEWFGVKTIYEFLNGCVNRGQTVQEALVNIGNHVGVDSSRKSGLRTISDGMGGTRQVDWTKPLSKEEWPALFQKAGFDGMTHIGGSLRGSKAHRVWIAFEPNQIKAVDNRGTFDEKDNRMNYEKRIESARLRYERASWDESRVVRDEVGKFSEWSKIAKPTSVMDAARKLDVLRNSRHDHDANLEELANSVDEIGRWLATQKNSPRLVKLLSECHWLGEQLRGGSGKPGVHFQVEAIQTQEAIDGYSKQRGLFDEDEHPRESDGTFAEKDGENPLYEVAGEEGVVARIMKHDKGYSLVVHDTEAGQPLPTITIFPTLEAAKSAADKFRPKEHVGVPGMQQSLFDAEPSGQKKLFDYVAPKKADSRKAKQADLLDNVDPRLKRILKAKETLSPADLLTNVTHAPLRKQQSLLD